MNLFSLSFVVLWAVVLLILYFTTSSRLQNRVLLVASIVFYAAWDYRFLALLALLIISSYYAARFHEHRVARVIGVCLPLFTLGLFKYYDFFVGSFCELLRLGESATLALILPLGISFYSFLAISYVLDVAKGKVAAADLTTVALYISFFPTVVSGPITKARDLLPQLGAPRAISSAAVAAGVQQFIIGCLKKFVVADNLAPFVNAVYQAPGAYDTPTVWLAVISFSLQLYFDFAGYSDMAIGVARTLGLQLAENFNMPYLAKSVSEFWKRWHMSLSSWLQEYLYFSLGGSRAGRLRTFSNLLLTMTICGLWHGAAMTFVVWGFLHGVLLCLQRIYRDGLGSRLTLPTPCSIALTFMSVTLCWIFFRASSLANALAVFHRLFIPQMDAVFHPFVLSFIAIGILLVMVVCTIRHENYRAATPVVDLRRPLGFFIVCLELYALFALRYAGDNPFIYAAF